MSALLLSCALVRPTATVIQKPSMLRALPGERPWLFAHYQPHGYDEYMVEINTPGGGVAYLVVGPALRGSYDNALDAFFDLNRISTKGAGQIAVIDMDLLEFTSRVEELTTAAGGTGRARLTLGLRHTVRFDHPGGGAFEEIPVEVSAEEVIHYTTGSDFTDKAEALAAELFARLEHAVFDHLVKNDRPGKYVPHGSGVRPPRPE